MSTVTVPTVVDDDGRRPDTRARTWNLVADHGDTMTIVVHDDLLERVAAVESVVSGETADLASARALLRAEADSTRTE